MGRRKRKTNQEKEINTLKKELRETREKIEEIKKEHSKELEEKDNQHSKELEERDNQHSKELEQIKKDHSKELKKTEDAIKRIEAQNITFRNHFSKGKDAGASGSPHTDKKEGLKFSDKITPLGEGSPTDFDIPAQKVEATDMCQGPKNVETCEQVEANNGSEMPRDLISLKSGEDHNYGSKRERKSRTSVPSRKSRTVHVVKEPEEETQGQNVRYVPNDWEDQSEESGDDRTADYSYTNTDENSPTSTTPSEKHFYKALPTTQNWPQILGQLCVDEYIRLCVDHDVTIVASLIATFLKVVKNVHLEKRLIKNISFKNVIVRNVDRRLVVMILGIDNEFSQDLSITSMLKRCQIDLVQAVEICWALLDLWGDIKYIKKWETYLTDISKEFDKIEKDEYLKCSAILEYLILFGLDSKPLRALIQTYKRTPDHKIKLGGEEYHLFDLGCSQCFYRNVSQQIFSLNHRKIEKHLNLRPNLVIGENGWIGKGKGVIEEDLVMCFYDQGKPNNPPKNYAKSVKYLIRLKKNGYSHLVEKMNKNPEIFQRLGIGNDAGFDNYVDGRFPKLKYHILSAIAIGEPS